MERKNIFIVCLLTLCTNLVHSQTILQPNYALKSHETLEIKKIETTSEKTTIYLSVENRIADGNFCADKNIFIVYPDGSRSKLTSSGGIPVCPDTYKFKLPGEKLDFTLTFHPCKPGIVSIDLIEDCTENCFSFYGVILDEDLNKKIDDAFFLATTGQKTKAMERFVALAEETHSSKAGAEGLIFINIIKLAAETGNSAIAAEWYKKVKLLNTPLMPLYVKHLNAFGISY
jgi:hypothetical protein